jgi:hypothetical protein
MVKEADLQEFEEAEKRLIQHFDGDAGAKDPNNPYICTLTFDRLYEV